MLSKLYLCMMCNNVLKRAKAMRIQTRFAGLAMRWGLRLILLKIITFNSINYVAIYYILVRVFTSFCRMESMEGTLILKALHSVRGFFYLCR